MNKARAFAMMIFACSMASFVPGAYAGSFVGIPNCNTGGIWGFTGICCHDECVAGQDTCSQDGTKVYSCEQNSFWDQCFHWNQAGARTCSYGCKLTAGIGDSGAICYNVDPCKLQGNTNACVKEGDKRCAAPGTPGCSSKQTGCIIECKQNGFGCLEWDTSTITYCGSNQICVGNQCQNYEEQQKSECQGWWDITCSPDQKYEIHCVKDPTSSANVWRWSKNAQDSYGYRDGEGWVYCGVNGLCSEDLGCSARGSCLVGSETRCDPEYPDYIQLANQQISSGCYDWNFNYVLDYTGSIKFNTDGTPIRDISKQQYCPHGCHLGTCNVITNDPCTNNCTIGDKICGGDSHGVYVQQCDIDYTNPARCTHYSKLTDYCSSGQCSDGECVSSFGGGNRIKMDFKNVTGSNFGSLGLSLGYVGFQTYDIGDDRQYGLFGSTNLFSDGQYLYLGGWTSINLSTNNALKNPNKQNYTVNRFDYGGVWNAQFSINTTQPYTFASSITYDEFSNVYWVSVPIDETGTFFSPSHNNSYIFKLSKSDFSYIASFTNLPLGQINGLAANKDFLFVLNTTYSIDDYHPPGTIYEGVLAFWKENMSLAYSFCLTANATQCISNQSYLYYEKSTDKLYTLNEKSGWERCGLGNTGGPYTHCGMFKGQFQFELQSYSSTGYYYESYKLNSGRVYRGFTKLQDRWYFFAPDILYSFPDKVSCGGVGDPCPILPFTLVSEIGYLENWNNIAIVKDECVNGSSRCGGWFGNEIQQCVQTPNGNWKWFTSISDCNDYSRSQGSGYKDSSGIVHSKCEMIACPATCTNAWANHLYMVAQCQSSTNCPDQCNITETKCDSTGRYVQKCVYGNIYSTTSVNAVSSIAVNCNHWEPFINWTACRSNERCINGKCILNLNSRCQQGESRCINWNDPRVTKEELSTLFGPAVEDESKLTNQFSNFGIVNPCILDPDLGNYTWQQISKSTPCYWGCNETLVNNLWNASCAPADKYFIEARSMLNEIRGGLWSLTGTTDSGRMVFVAIFTLIMSAIMAFYIDWRVGALTGITIIISAAMLQWFGVISLPVVGVFICVVGFIIYKLWSGD